MRNVVSILAVLCVLCGSAYAQTQYKASQGLPTARDQAKGSGLANAKLTAIATLGDTTFFGSYVPSLVKSLIKFDASKGTSAFWGYRFHDILGGKDTSLAFIVLKLAIVYQAVQAPIPALPGLPIQMDSALPATFMDSDIMTKKIAANGSYKQYMASYPNARYQAAALGMSTGGFYPEGPLWICYVGDKITDVSLACFVEAKDSTGTAECIVVPASDVNDSPTAERPALSPLPATNNSVTLTIPLSCYMPRFDLDIVDLHGRVVKSYPTQEVAGDTKVLCDLQGVQAGMYIMRLRGSAAHYNLPLIVE